MFKRFLLQSSFCFKHSCTQHTTGNFTEHTTGNFTEHTTGNCTNETLTGRCILRLAALPIFIQKKCSVFLFFVLFLFLLRISLLRVHQGAAMLVRSLVVKSRKRLTSGVFDSFLPHTTALFTASLTQTVGHNGCVFSHDFQIGWWVVQVQSTMVREGAGAGGGG